GWCWPDSRRPPPTASSPSPAGPPDRGPPPNSEGHVIMALPPYPASDFPDTPTAIVTGGASERGIGRATAHRLARDGWAVAVLDLDEAASQEVAAQIAREHGTPALGLGVDIADEQAVTAAVARIDAELPQLVGVVNIAGISSPTPVTQVSTEEWKRVFDVNVHGTFFVTREAVKVFRPTAWAASSTSPPPPPSAAAACTGVPPTPGPRPPCWAWPRR